MSLAFKPPKNPSITLNFSGFHFRFQIILDSSEVALFAIVCYYTYLMVEDSLKRRDDSCIPPVFCEVQYFRSNKAMYLVYLIMFVAIAVLLFEVSKLQSRGIKPIPLYFALCIASFIYLMILTMKMTTEVNIYEVKFIMFPFMLKAKRFQLSEIDKVNVTKYHPILEYGG